MLFDFIFSLWVWAALCEALKKKKKNKKKEKQKIISPDGVTAPWGQRCCHSYWLFSLCRNPSAWKDDEILKAIRIESRLARPPRLRGKCADETRWSGKSMVLSPDCLLLEAGWSWTSSRWRRCLAPSGVQPMWLCSLLLQSVWGWVVEVAGSKFPCKWIAFGWALLDTADGWMDEWCLCYQEVHIHFS